MAAGWRRPPLVTLNVRNPNIEKPPVMNNSRAPFVPSPPADAVPGEAVTHEAITVRAQRIWMDHGCPENCDECIWLEAEAELMAIQENRFRHPNLLLKSQVGSKVA